MDITISNLKPRLGHHVSRVEYGGERVRILRRGKPAAVLVSVEDEKRLQAMDDAEQAELAREHLESADGAATLNELTALTAPAG